MGAKNEPANLYFWSNINTVEDSGAGSKLNAIPYCASVALVSSWSLPIRGILAALRQIFHLSNCPNLPGHLCLSRWAYQEAS